MEKIALLDGEIIVWQTAGYIERAGRFVIFRYSEQPNKIKASRKFGTVLPEWTHKADPILEKLELHNTDKLPRYICKNGTRNIQGIVDESCTPDFKGDKIHVNERRRCWIHGYVYTRQLGSANSPCIGLYSCLWMLFGNSEQQISSKIHQTDLLTLTESGRCLTDTTSVLREGLPPVQDSPAWTVPE